MNWRTTSPKSPTLRASVTACVSCLAFAADACAQSPACNATPAPLQVIRSGVNWYPDPPPSPPFWWADRRPTAVIQMFNGNWNGPAGRNERGLEWRWSYGENAVAPCPDTDIDDYATFDVESGVWSPNPPPNDPGNGRPDQIDWLLAQLDNRWDRGYRRIVLFLPAGAPICQKFAQAQWWPMAQWRRDWFEALGSPNTDTEGIRGWIEEHKALAAAETNPVGPLEMGVYIGWWLADDACSICTDYRAGAGGCPVEQALTCDGNLVQGIWMQCPPGLTKKAPDTTSPADMQLVWQNIQPWRAIGIEAFWIDNSSGAASASENFEWRQFVYNHNFIGLDPHPIFGGEAFPTGLLSGTYPNRYFPEWVEFNFSRWITDLVWAERACQNGAHWNNLDDPDAHQWDIGYQTVREGAIYFSQWPQRSEGCEVAPGAPLHPHWDGILDGTSEPYPFERIRNLAEWYLCKGFCFWQTDLPGAPGLPIVSGAAERIFGFGQIMPPGDFDGDGDWHPMAEGNKDWEAWWDQYLKWTVGEPQHSPPIPTGEKRTCFVPETQVLTYYHGDMNGDGEVNGADRVLAEQWIRNGLWGNPAAEKYYLGEGGNNEEGSHRMNWNPNQKWFPCEGCQPGPSNSFSSMGPP